jgi:hypothetical protein
MATWKPIGSWRNNFKMEKNQTAVDWIDVAYDRHKWRSVVNTVMNLRVLQNDENFLSVRETPRRNISSLELFTHIHTHIHTCIYIHNYIREHIFDFNH